MHILHIYKDYFPVLGGIENHIRTLAELQSDTGHTVSVLVTNPGGLPAHENLKGVDVIRLPRLATVASAPISLSFFSAIRRIDADIAHLHTPYPVGEAAYLAAAGNRPYIVTYHSDVVRQRRLLQVYRPVLNRLLDRAGRILPTSDRYMRSSPFLAGRLQNCSIVGLSTNPDVFGDGVPRIPKGTKPVVLFVGRHRYYKGIDDLLRAAAGLDVSVLIGGDGPLRSELERMAVDLGMAGMVTFTGEVPDEDLPGLYASADIFVLPANARAEAFGIVLLEAMASRLPCVTTELGTGTSFVVQDGVTGLVVPPNEPAALRAAILRLVEDPALRLRFGEAGRVRVQENFTPAVLHRRVMEIYEEVLARRRPA